MLRITDLNAWYGESRVLQGVRFDVSSGEIVTLIGRNGAGKSTILKSVMGILTNRRGSILLEGRELIELPSRKIARLGIGYVPEDRGIYASLNVKENLYLPPQVKPPKFSNDEIFGLFPNLRERLKSLASKLSGGEQQMLAIARILRTGAHLLLLDEPTEGLAPVIIDQIGEAIRFLKQGGLTVVLVEQNFQFAKDIADRHYVIEQGRVVDVVSSAEIESSAQSLQRYLGV